jgi:hypothetical protein
MTQPGRLPAQPFSSVLFLLSLMALMRQYPVSQ